MVNKYKTKTFPIDPLTAKITMVFLGLLLVVLSFVINDILIVFKDTSITHYIVGVVLIMSAVIGYVELGLKRWTDWSKLKQFENQQLLSFAITSIVLVSGLLNLFNLNILGFWNSGSIFFSGAIIILEALR